MYSLKKVLPTLDNIRTDLKQSIGNTGRDLLQMKFAYTRCGVNRKVLMERQDVVLSRIRYLRRVRELVEAGIHSRLYMMMTPRQTVMKLLNKYKTKQTKNKKNSRIYSCKLNTLKSFYNIYNLLSYLKIIKHQYMQ